MSETRLRCYYEVLEVDRKATIDEIRRAYKYMAVIHHPDKNYGNTDSAVAKFKEIQNAYSILSDPDERAWYDAHRESIINGGDPSDYHEGTNLYNYFTSRCYDGFDDSEGGFYSVYRKLFNEIIEEEKEFSGNAEGWPRFGDSSSEWTDVLKFYSHWKNFSTFKTFAWKDEHKINEFPDRGSRRMAERINQKARAAEKKEYVQTVSTLVQFVYRRDPRVKAEKERQEEEERAKAEIKEQKELEKVKRRQAVNKKLWAEAAEKEAAEEQARLDRGEALDGSTLELLYEKQRQTEEMRKTKGGASSQGFAMLEGDDDDNDEGAKGLRFNCPACKKNFKSEGQYKEHIGGGKHKTKLRQLTAKGVDVEALMKGPE